MWATQGNHNQITQEQKRLQFTLNCNFYSYIYNQIRTNEHGDWSEAITKYLEYAKKIKEDPLSLTMPSKQIQTQIQTQTKALSNNEEENDENENITENEIQPEQEIKDETEDEQNVLQIVSTLYCMRDAWKPFGKGTFKLIIDKSNPKKARMLFRLNSGKKVVLNAVTYKGMKVERKGKSDILFACFVASGTKNEMTQFLLRLPDPEQANATKTEIEKRIPK